MRSYITESFYSNMYISKAIKKKWFCFDYYCYNYILKDLKLNSEVLHFLMGRPNLMQHAFLICKYLLKKHTLVFKNLSAKILSLTEGWAVNPSLPFFSQVSFDK